MARSVSGRPFSRAGSGHRCRARMGEEGYPDEAGFGMCDPYGSMPWWIKAQAILMLTRVSGSSETTIITLAAWPGAAPASHRRHCDQGSEWS